eukprot:EG_transcript_7991
MSSNRSAAVAIFAVCAGIGFFTAVLTNAADTALLAQPTATPTTTASLVPSLQISSSRSVAFAPRQPLSALPATAAAATRAVTEAPAVPRASGTVMGLCLIAIGVALAAVGWRLRASTPAGCDIESAPLAMFAASGAPAGFSPAISEAELAKQPNSQARVTVNGVDLMLVKEGAQVYAVQARCSHLPLKLLGSKVEGGVLTCSKHGSKFSCATGEVVEWLPGGGINNVLRMASSQPCPLKAYQTQVKDGQVYVNVPPQVAMFASTGSKEWKLVISEADLAKQPNQQARASVDGVDLMVVKDGATLYAMQARCSHLPLKLLGSKVENGVITCSKHGSKFDCATGQPKEWLPGGGMNNVLRMASPDPCALKVYETKVSDGNIYVSL